MASVKSHTGHPLSASATTIRRKPALTYRSPVRSVAPLHPETPLPTSPGVPPPPVVAKLLPTRLPDISSVSDISERITGTHKQTPHHFLPLYHPFGMLALSLPDLDAAAFGLPVPVAVFDDPPRSSNRVRRPAAKIREADEPVALNHTHFIDASPATEIEPKSKPSPSRRRGGGGNGGPRRKRKETEDSDATYPAKRPRNARSSGVTPSIPVIRTPSRDAVSPTASNPNTGASPAPDAERGDPAEEKKPTRRTRGRGVVARRGSTASEATVISASPSVSATNAAVPQAASAGQPAETPMEAEVSNEDTKNAS